MPLRLEIGPKDIEKSQVVLARRDTREKASMPMDGLAGARRRRCSTRSRQALLQRARQVPRGAHDARRQLRRVQERRWKGGPGFVIAGWCGSGECEAEIKAETQATLRNIPFGSEGIAGTCVKCGKPSSGEAWFAKAY